MKAAAPPLRVELSNSEIRALARGLSYDLLAQKFTHSERIRILSEALALTQGSAR